MIATFYDQHYDQTSADMMNISNVDNGGSSLGESRHHSLFSPHHHREFVVDPNIKDGLLINDFTSSEPSPVSLGQLFHYPVPYRQVKRRRRLTEEETNVLISTFEKVQKPDAEMRTRLAAQLNMSSRAIQVWFQNRRAKVKRDALESKNAAKFNRPKKLTLAAEYCQEKRINNSESIHSSPISSTSSITASPIDFKTQEMTKITPNLANISIALTSDNEHQLDTTKENSQSLYYSQLISNNQNNIIGLIHETVYDNYWNTVENDEQSIYYSPEDFETTPVTTVQSFPEHMYGTFYHTNDNSTGFFNWQNKQNLPLSLVTPPGMNRETPVAPNNTPISNNTFIQANNRLLSIPITLESFPTAQNLNFPRPLREPMWLVDLDKPVVIDNPPTYEYRSLQTNTPSSQVHPSSTSVSSIFTSSAVEDNLIENDESTTTAPQSPYSVGFDNDIAVVADDDNDEIDLLETLCHQEEGVKIKSDEDC
ncbi:homeobox-domain-containing protein [Gigaspora margarita]|uniref:Homeobox-domain-containing protein n=1 Tax=Gigaspora margarita TaxID=4874 RepID=A0A8H3XGG0_GIGMA|nr:homeobox-domain-containing protein [Gigaspora margarita]